MTVADRSIGLTGEGVNEFRHFQGCFVNFSIETMGPSMDGPNRSSNVTLVSPDSKGKEVGQAELMPHRDRKSTAPIAVGPIASRLAEHRDLTATSHSYAKTVGVLVGTLGFVAVFGKP